MMKKRWVIVMSVEKSKLFFNTDTKACSVDIRFATQYNEKKAAVMETKQMFGGCWKGTVMDYEEAKLLSIDMLPKTV